MSRSPPGLYVASNLNIFIPARLHCCIIAVSLGRALLTYSPKTHDRKIVCDNEVEIGSIHSSATKLCSFFLKSPFESNWCNVRRAVVLVTLLWPSSSGTFFNSTKKKYDPLPHNFGWMSFPH